MSNNQYRKLLFSFVTSIILIVTVIILLVMILNKPKDIQVNNYIGKDGQSIKGDPGYTPIKGLDYFDGIDSLSTHTEKIITQTVVEKQQDEPIKGEKGDKGDSGLQILIQTDYDRCVLQTKYDGDDLWTDVAKLQSPCKLETKIPKAVLSDEK